MLLGRETVPWAKTPSREVTQYPEEREALKPSSSTSLTKWSLCVCSCSCSRFPKERRIPRVTHLMAVSPKEPIAIASVEGTRSRPRCWRGARR